MEKTNKNKKMLKIVQGCIIGLLTLVLIAANVVVWYFADLITLAINGFGLNTDNLNTDLSETVVQDIAAEGVVLLRNEYDTLPLNGITTDADGKMKINVFGWSATDNGFMIAGVGSTSPTKKTGITSLLKGLESQGFVYNKDVIDFYEDFQAEREGPLNSQEVDFPFFNLIEPKIDDVQPYIDEAVDFSNYAMVVLSRRGGEGKDLPREQHKSGGLPNDNTRTYLQISTEEEDLISSVVATFGSDKTIVIINTGNVMEAGFLEEYDVGAALWVGPMGQSGVKSVVDVLKGEINPSGKTTDTWAYQLKDAASYATGNNGCFSNSAKGGVKQYSDSADYYIDYNEGIYVGYKWYETADAEGYWDERGGYESVVQYPFGHGLTYGEGFEWEVTSVSPASGSTITETTDISVTVKVTNNDDTYTGKDVVQLYYTPQYYANGIEKAAKNLVAFAKTDAIEPGKSDEVTLTFKAGDMKSYDYNDANGNDFTGYELEHGSYTISVSTDAHNASTATGSVITYNVASDIKMREVDGAEVVNQFTGTAGDFGLSVDGSNAGQNITYMTRSNFAGTFPKITTETRALAHTVTNAKLYTDNNSYTMPTQGVAGDLKLYNSEEDMNIELIKTLGSNYDHEQWDALLNQMSIDDLLKFIEFGGYYTDTVESIGKPRFWDLDGPAGLTTSNLEVLTSEYSAPNWSLFPSAAVVAASWNEDVSYVYGMTLANEANASGVSGWYAPGVNIHRSPFGGRNNEYYSEDGFLSGKMAAKVTRGAVNNGVYCYVKHFAANEAEYKRVGIYTWLTEQALREIYLKPFEICVKEGKANAIMSSFNRLGATWAGGSKSLLTNVLRNEWGFKGSVITDYFGQNQNWYMNMNQGVMAGGDLWLSGNQPQTVSFTIDRTSAAEVNYIRTAAHNILFTYCNTVYEQSLFLDSDEAEYYDDYLSGITAKYAEKPAATWIWILVVIDVVAFAGLAVWAYFALIRKSKTVV